MMQARKTPITYLILAITLCFVYSRIALAAEPLVHTVAKGETLYSIARRYDVLIDELLKINNIKDASKIFAGMKLTIPGNPAQPDNKIEELIHVVKKNDTLFSISRSYGITIESILKENDLSGTTIKEGQKLKIITNQAMVATKDIEDKAKSQSASKVIIPDSQLPSYSSSVKSWPVQGSISQLQGKLKGVAISTETASVITAIRAGTVVSAGPFRGFNLVAFVQASDGLVYVYGGAESLAVKLGDFVRKGSVIGKMSAEQASSAYFFVFKGAETIDPSTAPRD